MKSTEIIVACCVLWLSRGLATSRRELADFVKYIERTSRLFQHSKESLVCELDDEESNAWENGDKFEGDMILDSRQRLQIIQDVALGGHARNGHKHLDKRWPANEVIYFIEKNMFSPEQINMIKKAIETITRVSCVKFRKRRSSDRSAIVIQGNPGWCYSHVGYKKMGFQTLNLQAAPVGKGCFRLGSVLHEFLHALGFYHMQSTANRDDYVRVHWENIIPTKRRAFMKYSAHDVTDFGVPYDYESIMHYSRKANSVNGKDTLTPTLPNAVVSGQRNAMTASDIEKLNLMYCKTKSPRLKTLERLSKLRYEFSIGK